MTRPPPFSPLSVCPKPLPGPRPFGTRTPAQAASSPRLSDRGRKGTRVLFILSHFPRQCKSFAPLFAKKARADNLRGRRTPIKTCSCAGICKRRTVGGNSRRRAGIIRGLHRDEAKPTGQRRKSGPAPLRVRCTRSGAGPRCAAGLRSTTVIGSRPDRRSDPHAAADALPSKKADGILIADPPPHKRRSRGSVLRRPVRFFGAFCSPLSCFSVRQYSIILT